MATTMTFDTLQQDVQALPRARRVTLASTPLCSRRYRA
jgi:hypothetical protein